MSKLSQKLTLAKQVKNDEFYTYEVDIAKEMIFWFEHLRNKTIYLPYDTINSNFYKYFLKHKEHLNLKIILGNNAVVGGISDITNLQNCDIVITNPPFSKLRQFQALLEQYKKQFIIIVPLCALANRDIFNKIKDDKYFVGNEVKHFYNEKDQDKTVQTFWLNNIEPHNFNLPKKKAILPIEPHLNVFNLDGQKVLNMNKINNVYYIKEGLLYAVPITILYFNYKKLNVKLLKVLPHVKIDGKQKFKRVLITKIDYNKKGGIKC